MARAEIDKQTKLSTTKKRENNHLSVFTDWLFAGAILYQIARLVQSLGTSSR